MDKCLIRKDADGGGEPRYRMLETVREFGLERIADGGEEAAIRKVHAVHFAAFAEAIGTHSVWQPNPGAVFTRFDADQDNLRGAVAAGGGSGLPHGDSHRRRSPRPWR